MNYFYINLSHELKVPSPQLKPEEEALFGGLAQSSKGQGRIYKKLNAKGDYTYFRASGFFSSLYHFLFSKRIDKSDLEKINGRVIKWMQSTDDISSQLRVEVAFNKIFKHIQQNSVFTFLQGEEGNRLLFQGDHLKLFLQIADKVQAQEKKPSETGQKSELLTQEEIALFRQLSKMSAIWAYPHIRQAIDKLKKTSHPANIALQKLFSVKDSFTNFDIKALKEKARTGKLSEFELRNILLAKAKLAELRSQCGSYLDIESFRSSFQGLDQILEIDTIKNTQISEALRNRTTVMNLCYNNGWIVACASEELQKDPTLIQWALNQKPEVLPFAINKAKTDVAVARMLVETYPYDKELLKQLVQWHGSVIQYATFYKTDKSIVKLALAQDFSVFNLLLPHLTTDSEIVQFVIQKYPDNVDFFKSAIQKDGLLLQYGSDAMRSDPEIVKLATQQNPEAIQFAPDEIKREMAKQALEKVFNEQPHPEFVSLPISIQAFALQEVLKTVSPTIEAKHKTTLWSLTERIAQKYLIAGDGVKAMELRMKTAQALAPAHPLANLHLQLSHADSRLGLRISSVDTSFIKNQVLAVQKRTFATGVSQLHLEGKLSHHTRADLQSTLDFAENHTQKFFDALPKGFCQAVHVTDENDDYYGRKEKNGERFAGDFSTDVWKDGLTISDGSASQVRVIHFAGVGKVKVGNSSNYRGVYNRISVDLDPGVSDAEATAKLNVLFAALGLGPANSSSRENDIERIKVLQLFRAFYPREAYKFERDSSTFIESIESLKAKIASEVPDMQAKFKYYFEEHPEFIYQQEVYPGQPVWAIKGLANEVRSKGAIGLMAGLTADTFTVATTRLASILKSGALSSQDRFQVGIITKGDSSVKDIQMGGAESAFTRMITQNMPLDPIAYPLCGKMQILYDLDLVERVGYAYSTDQYGSKVASSYISRPNIVSLAEQLMTNPNLHNEVCIRNRISPQFIKGVLVAYQSEKTELINTLRAQGLITQNLAKQDCINGIPIDQFIHIGEFKAEYWA